jgi:hypothetical protein
VQEVEFYGVSRDAAVDWLQQWGTSITFGCEVPFPSPLQCDAVPDGVRFAVISAAGGHITCLGELYLEVDGERLEAEAVAAVAVTRVSKAPARPLLSEREILRALKNALRCARTHATIRTHCCQHSQDLHMFCSKAPCSKSYIGAARLAKSQCGHEYLKLLDAVSFSNHMRDQPTRRTWHAGTRRKMRRACKWAAGSRPSCQAPLGSCL